MPHARTAPRTPPAAGQAIGPAVPAEDFDDPEALAPSTAASLAARLMASRRMVQRLADCIGTAGVAPGAGPASVLETHISWIVLAEATAYKVKKPVALGFMDASRLADRRHFCEEELRLNRRLAPSLYLGVTRITGTPEEPHLDGDGPTIDYAVRMRRFPPGALFSEHAAAGTLRPSDIDALASLLGRLHDGAPRAGATEAFGQPAMRRATALRAWEGVAAQCASRGPDLARLRDWLEREAERLEPLWSTRLAAGSVREVHGDLHLANLLLLDDEVTAFDGIDFEPSLRWIDIVDDAAFAMMDLLAHRQGPLAFRFFNAWLDATHDHDGLPLWRFALVGRALVRAQVGLIRQAQGGRSDPGPGIYLDLALRLALGPRDPRLLVTHGLPGSGKSVAALALVETVGGVRLRSDVLREGRHGARDYSAAARHRNYERLASLAGLALDEGWPTVVDAACLASAERGPLAAVAAARGLPFTLLDCRAPEPLLRERLHARAQRGDDPSEADEAVLGRMLASASPLSEAEQACCLVHDAASPRPLSSIAAAWQAHRA